MRGLHNSFKAISPWHLSSISVIRWWLIFSVDRWVTIASVTGPLFIFHIKLLTCSLLPCAGIWYYVETLWFSSIFAFGKQHRNPAGGDLGLMIFLYACNVFSNTIVVGSLSFNLHRTSVHNVYFCTCRLLWKTKIKRKHMLQKWLNLISWCRYKLHICFLWNIMSANMLLRYGAWVFMCILNL